MSVGRILLMLALAPAAHAQLSQERLTLPQEHVGAADPDALLTGLPFSMRLELNRSLSSEPALSPAAISPAGSPVFTSDYWSRSYADRAEWQVRFGIHPAGQLVPSLVQSTPIPGHPQFNFVQEMRWPSGKPLTGLQFERRDLLFTGDRLNIRATSDLQTLFRGVGVAGSEAEVDMLSLLGWHSHSRMVWQLGEPTRELQWQFSAGFDRKAYSQSSTVDFQVLRRF